MSAARRLVMWDVDLTLLRAGDVAVRAWQAAFVEVTGVPWRTTPRFAGRTDTDVCAEVFATHGVTDCPPERFFTRYVEMVHADRHLFAEQGTLLPGVPEVLHRLAAEPHVVQTLVTGNVPAVAAAKVAAFGLSASFDAEVGGYGTDDAVRAVLVRRSRERAESKYGRRLDAVVVGDTVHDVAAALANDAYAVGVATGGTSAGHNRPMPFAAPAPVPDDDVGELADLIVTWSGLVLAGFGLLMSVLTILFVAAGFVGIRELRSIRETGQRARRELDEHKKVAGEILDEGNRAVQAAESLSVEANELLDRARRAAEVTEAQSEQIRQLNERLQIQISDLDQRVSTIVEVSYLFNQGEAAYRSGQYEKAIDLLQRALELDPKNARVRYRLGRSLTNLGRDAEAAQELRAAIDGGLSRDRGERALAYLYRYTDPVAAQVHASRATEAGPDHAPNWNCLGLLRRDIGDFAGSRDAHLRAYELNPELITTPFYLALLAAQSQAFPQARERSTEAMHRLEEGERRARIKNIWAAVIRWADTVLRGSYDEADRYAAELSEECPSARRAQEICDHMEFLLRALGREQYRERYVGSMERTWLTGTN